MAGRMPEPRRIVRNGKWDCDLEQGSVPASPVKVDIPAVIFDDPLRYRESQSAAFGLSVARKGLKDGVSYRRRNAGAVIPDANLQPSAISGCGYDDLPRVWRDRLASVQDEVGDHSLHTARVEPADGQAFMMVLDGNATELLFHSRHANRAPDSVDDVAGRRLKRVTTLGKLQQ